MSELQSVHDKILAIFNVIQTSSSTHQKNIVLLQKLFTNHDLDVFVKAFVRIINKLVQQEFKHKPPHVEKAIDFLTLFCARLQVDDDENEGDDNCVDSTDSAKASAFLNALLDELLDLQDVDRDCVRYRACQIMNRLFDNLVGMGLDSDVCSKIEKAMLERIRDVKLPVSLQAVLVAHRLQDYTNMQCPMIQAFIHAFGHPKAQMRKLCVEKIALRKDVLPHVLDRIRDVDVTVREAALLRLSVTPKILKISQRQTVIKTVKSDSTESVQKIFANKLIPGWYNGYDCDILKFLNALRLDATEQDLKDSTECSNCILNILMKERLRQNILDVLNLKEKLLPHSELNWETARYWTFVVQYFREGVLEDSFNEEILPELVVFCNYISEYCALKHQEDALERQFILGQLFTIAQGYDMADPISRQTYNQLIRDTLIKETLSSELIIQLVSALEVSIPKITDREIFINEIASEVIYCTQQEIEDTEEQTFKLAELKVKLNCAIENMTSAVESEDFDTASTLKKELEILKTEIEALRQQRLQETEMVPKTDVPSILKYLNIVHALLYSSKIPELTPTQRILKNDMVEGFMLHGSVEVQIVALKCFALFCILDKKTCESGVHILASFILSYMCGEKRDEQLLLVAVKGLSDLLLLHGPSLLANPQEEGPSESMDEQTLSTFKGGTSLTTVVNGFLELMNDENSELQEFASRAVCKLILYQNIRSPQLITKLILMWCNPAQENESMKQLIGKTLEQLPGFSDFPQVIQETFFSTTDYLIGAPPTSPLSDVNVLDIAKYLLILCRCCSLEHEIYLNVATRILSKFKKSNPRYNLMYSKILLSVDLSNASLLSIENLLKLCDRLRDEIKEKNVLTNIVKFAAQLTSIHSNLVQAGDLNMDVNH